MRFHKRSQRSQRQPESQSRKEYAWPSAFLYILLILFYFRSDSDLTSQLVATRSELATLQERYDALHADRDRLAQTLSENMKKYKRFKRWIFTNKGKIPPKSTERDEMRPYSCSSSTPGLQQQSVIKMLETPMTPMSLCPLSFFVSV
jgi:CRISPR/Cas system endoribonuclease Cas6 (RAMP superfamily)